MGRADITPPTGYYIIVLERDLTYRPAAASGGRAVARVGRRRVVAHARRGPVLIAVPVGRSLRVPAGAARDRHGNVNASAFVLRG